MNGISSPTPILSPIQRIWSPLETGKGWDFESHPLCVWLDTKQPTTKIFGPSRLHSNLWEESRSYLSRSFCFFLSLFSLSCICETIPWVSGLAPILSDVRICCPSLGSERGREEVGLAASRISAIGPTRLSSRRDISSATSLGKTGMEIDQVKILSSTGEKREVEILLP